MQSLKKDKNCNLKAVISLKMTRKVPDSTKLPGKEIDWDNFEIDAEPEETESENMFKLTQQEREAL